MTITREPDYPPEYAQLAMAFAQCADGHELVAILNASMQMLSISIGAMCELRGASLEETQAYADYVCALVMKEVTSNWNRETKPTDVEVKAS